MIYCQVDDLEIEYTLNTNQTLVKAANKTTKQSNEDILQQILSDFCLKERPSNYQQPIYTYFSGNDSNKNTSNLIFKFIQNSANSNVLLKMKHIVHELAGYKPLDPA